MRTSSPAIAIIEAADAARPSPKAAPWGVDLHGDWLWPDGAQRGGDPHVGHAFAEEVLADRREDRNHPGAWVGVEHGVDLVRNVDAKRLRTGGHMD
jgi:hypothetical protein